MQGNGCSAFPYHILITFDLDISVCSDLIFRFHIVKDKTCLRKICVVFCFTLYVSALEQCLLFFCHGQFFPDFTGNDTVAGISKWQCLFCLIYGIFFILRHFFIIAIWQIFFMSFLDNKIPYSGKPIQYRTSIQSVIHLFNRIGRIHFPEKFCYSPVCNTVIKICTVETVLHCRIFSGNIAVLIIAVKSIRIFQFFYKIVLCLICQPRIRSTFCTKCFEIIGLIR